MCAMSSHALVVAIWPEAIECDFYGFYDLKILLCGSLWRIRRVLFDTSDPRLTSLTLQGPALRRRKKGGVLISRRCLLKIKTPLS